VKSKQLWRLAAFQVKRALPCAAMSPQFTPRNLLVYELNS
jgi:hypothetical protein